MQKSGVGVKKSDDIGMFPIPIEVVDGDVLGPCGIPTSMST